MANVVRSSRGPGLSPWLAGLLVALLCLMSILLPARTQAADSVEPPPCTGEIGDFAWVDTNDNGCQDANEPGLAGVTVKLYAACTGNLNPIATTVTDATGFYRFTNLCAGDYQVEFVTPAGFTQTMPNQVCDPDPNVSDGKDSDCSQFRICVNLPLDTSINLTVDCGYLPECPLAVDKKCFVEPPPPGSFVCSDAKPIDSMTVIWNGPQEPVYVKAWNGSVGTGTPQTFGPIYAGDEVTFTRTGTFPNDTYWQIYSNSGFTTEIGRSTFHLSCSDVDMNGPEDCGKVAGDGKAVAGYQNWWIFEGMAGSGQVLDCMPGPVAGADACSFAAPSPPDCATLGKPQSLTFQYTGSGCGESDNNQAADKWACSGVPGTAPVSITILKDPARITVTPSSGIVVGDLVTVSRKVATTEMGSEIQLYVGSQFLKIHTSCSQPLAVGDVFGSLELVKFNGQSAGADVTYTYKVTNTDAASVQLTSVVDDKLGELLPFFTKPNGDPCNTLLSGESCTAEATALISETTTNTVTVTGDVVGYDTECIATDSVTVTVKPPLTLSIDIKPGSYPNCFNQNGRGVIPVAILGSANLDVTQINVESLLLQGLAVKMVGKRNKYLAHIEYVNGDEYPDLVVQFQDTENLVAIGNGTATLTGELLNGTPIEGSDSICIVP
jgi:serine-aspartate repeat-containing protein C/D/E